LEHALDKMKEKTYSNADLVVVSDFLMADLQDSLLNEIQSLRDSGNKFHSLCIHKRLRIYFDQEWVFNPYTSSVTELIRFSGAV